MSIKIILFNHLKASNDLELMWILFWVVRKLPGRQKRPKIGGFYIVIPECHSGTLVSSIVYEKYCLLKYITNGSEAENPKYHCFDINIKGVNKLFVIFLFRNDIGIRSSWKFNKKYKVVIEIYLYLIFFAFINL